MARKCADCRYWSSDERCHRHAPFPVMYALFPDLKPQQTFVPDAQWPATDETDWCGEFQEKTGNDAD